MEIRDIKGNIKFTTPIYKGSIRRVNLMQEDYILLKFSTENVVNFNIGDSIPNGFELTESFKPTLNSKTNGYDYELRFDRYYYKWKNKKFFYAPDFGGREASWSLNADISTHLGVFLRNLKALGYKYNGLDFEFAVSETINSGSKLIQYDNIDLISSLTRIAEEWSCEWWVTDNVINFGKCEYGTPIDFTIGENVSSMPKSGANSATPTRIYAFGSERNIPENYRPIEDSIAVNGIVQKRLMLPSGIPYIDMYPNLTNEEAVEEIKIFDSVYPKRINKTSNVSREERKVKNENTEKLETQIIYGVKDDTLRFKQEYILPRQELRVTFQSGLLNGRDYGVEFKDDYFLIKEENNVPNDILYPQKGDEFVLYGYDTKFVDIQLLPEAEIELQKEAEKYVQELREDPTTYECKMMASYMFNEGNVKTFDLGDRVQLTNKALFDEPRVSRIMGYEYPLDKPYDNPVYYVGRKATYSRLNRIESKLDTLEYKEKLFSSTNVGVYIITQHDITTPTDRNVFSSKKSLNSFHRKDISDSTDYLQKFNAGAEFGDYKNKKGAYINEEGKADFNEVQSNKVTTKDLVATNTKTTNLEADVSTLKKATINDLVAQLATIHNLSVTDTAKILKAVVGSISSDTFKSGFAGEGFRIYEALNGDWNLEIDNVIVRKVFSVFELIVQKITHQGGMVINSPNGAKITKVTDGGSYWKCEHDSATDFFKDDQILCQNFSGDNVKRYWRLATNAGKGYLNLSKTDQEANSSIPSIGDEIVVLGNRANINRQSAIMVVSVGDNSPYTTYYSNINSYSLVGKESTRTGNLNGVVDKDFGALKGDGLFSENVYLKGIFRLTNGKSVERVIEDSSNSLTNSIQATKSELNASISKAEQTALLAQKSVDGLEIGGVNLILKSDVEYCFNQQITTTPNNYLLLKGNAYSLSNLLKPNTNCVVAIYAKGKGVVIPFVLGSTDLHAFNIDSEDYRWFYSPVVNKNYYKSKSILLYTYANVGFVGCVSKIMIQEGNKHTTYSPAPQDLEAYTDKQITSVRTDFQITEGQINGKLQETTQLLTESKTLSGEAKQTLASTTARVNEFNLTAKKFEGTLGEITKKQGEVEGSILNVQATANSLQASITGFKETEREIKETATRIEATHQGIVLEASEKSAQKAIDGLEIGGRNLLSLNRRHQGVYIYQNSPNYLAISESSKASSYVINVVGIQFISVSVSTDSVFENNRFGLAFYKEFKHGDLPLSLPFNFLKGKPNSDKYENIEVPKDATIAVLYYSNVGIDNIPTKIKLEKGNKATDWSPAPEDTEAKFTETNASLKVLADQIASEVSKTNGIRTDLTTLSQSHNSFKAQVKSDISGAIDSNNEVIRSSFEMKDNVITMIGKRVNVLAELKVGSNTLIKDGFINTDLLRVKSITADKIDVNSIFATRIQTGNLDVTAGATIGGFELGNGRIGVSGKVWDSTMNNGAGGYRPAEPGESSGGTDFGNLTIYKDFFKVGGKNGYVMFGDDVIPSSVGGAFNAVGRITNKRQNKGSDFSYDRANYGLFIEVDGGTKNYGLHSNAPLIAPSFVNTAVGELDFNDSTYNIDFSQHSIFIMNRSRGDGVTVRMPSEDSVAQHFGMNSLKNGFGFIFTVVAKALTKRIVLENIRNANHNLTNFAFGGGDSATILAHKTGGIFEYQMLTHNT